MVVANPQMTHDRTHGYPLIDSPMRKFDILACLGGWPGEAVMEEPCGRW